MIIYISGKYTDDTQEKIDVNIALARKHAIKLWEAGYTVICPHLNTANFEKDCKIEWNEYIKGDLEIISKCDAILMLHKWEESKGATIERQYARNNGIPIFYCDSNMNFAYIDELKQYIETQTNNPAPGIKYDDDKLRLDLVDYNQINKLAYILTMGAKKYSDSNWMKVEPFNSRYFAALLRHLFAWQAGFKIDKESGKSHLDHAMANLMFLMWGEDNGKK
jgi:CTP synthase (UTP-ammonia lyase)